MADADLRVRVTTTGENSLRRTRRELRRVGNEAVKTSAKLKAMALATSLNKSLEDMAKQFRRHFDELDALVKVLGNTLLKGLSVAIKATAAEFALMGASMIAVHGLFGIGNILMKAYQGTLNVLAGAAGSAALAIASVAAAMREQNAAMFAYKADGSYRQFGSNLNQVRVVMRGLESDTRMASVGVENLTAAYAAVSKRSTFTAGSQNLLSGLMDFASAGQPLDQGVKAAGELIGILQDPKASFSEITAAAEALGPSMKKAMEEAKKQGINTAAELKKAINDGTLAALGGVDGQADAVNNTLLGVFKGAFNTIRGMFADMGQPLLAPLKRAVDEILREFKRIYAETLGSLVRFNENSFMDGLVGAVVKTMELFRTLVVDYLPRAEGMMERISDRWRAFTEGWNRIVEALRPLIDGARVLERLLKSIFGPVWDRIKEKFGDFNQQLQDNEENLLTFGSALGEMLVSFGKITDTIRDLFFQSLPFLTKLFNGVKQVADLLNQILSTMGKLFGDGAGGFGAFGVLMGLGIIGRQMKNTKGGFLPNNVKDMAISANNVMITGATMGGQMDPRAAAAMQAGMIPPAAMPRVSPNMPFPVVGPTSPYVPPNGLLMGGGAAAGMQSARPPQYLSPQQGVQMGMTAKQTAQHNQLLNKQYQANRPPAFSGAAPGPLQRWSGIDGFRAKRAQSAAYQRIMRMNQTGTARMGAMMGLGMASQFMPEETQGAMALGSTIGAFNPLIGLGVAGVGAAMTSQNVLAGVGGGAAGGAALGMQVAGGPGAFVGALIGGVGGAIMSSLNKGKAQRKAAREAASAYAEGVMNSVVDGIKEASDFSSFTTENIRDTLRIDDMQKTLESGSIDLLKKNAALFGLELTDEQWKDARRKPEEFMNTMNEELGDTFRAAELFADRYSSKVETVSRMFNVSEREAIELARSLDVDLTDALQSTGDAVKELSKEMLKTKNEFNAALDIGAGAAVAALQQEMERAEAPFIYDEAAQAVVDQIREGTFDERGALAFAETAVTSLIQAADGNTIEAIFEANKLFGSQQTAFQQGQLFDSSRVDDESRALILGTTGIALDALNEAAANELLDQANAALGSVGLQTDLTVEDLMSMTPEAIFNASNALTAEDFVNGLEEGLIADDEVRDLIRELFTGFDNEIFVTEDSLGDLTNESENVTQALGRLKDAIEGTILALDPEEPGDTRTPRGDTLSSRYSRTMFAHNQLDSMVKGSRLITSGYRNFNLGSPSSDHVMGRAYDLVGQNLGAYQQAVLQNGGFAEFHGSGGGRHLHVVPNTSGPMGDTGSVAVMSGGGGGITNNNSYTINVNGANQSPEQIAEAVMDKIKRNAVSDRERR